jgi:hypothetical protein
VFSKIRKCKLKSFNHLIFLIESINLSLVNFENIEITKFMHPLKLLYFRSKAREKKCPQLGFPALANLKNFEIKISPNIYDQQN